MGAGFLGGLNVDAFLRPVPDGLTLLTILVPLGIERKCLFMFNFRTYFWTSINVWNLFRGLYGTNLSPLFSIIFSALVNSIPLRLKMPSQVTSFCFIERLHFPLLHSLLVFPVLPVLSLKNCQFWFWAALYLEMHSCISYYLAMVYSPILYTWNQLPDFLSSFVNSSVMDRINLQSEFHTHMQLVRSSDLVIKLSPPFGLLCVYTS